MRFAEDLRYRGGERASRKKAEVERVRGGKTRKGRTFLAERNPGRKTGDQGGKEGPEAEAGRPEVEGSPEADTVRPQEDSPPQMHASLPWFSSPPRGGSLSAAAGAGTQIGNGPLFAGTSPNQAESVTRPCGNGSARCGPPTHTTRPRARRTPRPAPRRPRELFATAAGLEWIVASSLARAGPSRKALTCHAYPVSRTSQQTPLLSDPFLPLPKPMT